MSDGLAADLEQQQRAREALGRPKTQPEPISLSVGEALEAHRGAHDAYLRRKALVIPSMCGGCAMDSQRMKGCSFSADDACKHTAALDARARARDRQARLKSAGVPGKFWSEIERIESCEALNAVRRVLSGETGIAVMLGTTGSGKSLVGGFAIAERGGVFAHASGLSGSEEKVEVLLRALHEAPLIILDDVGRGRGATPAAIERSEDLICNRYDRGLASLVNGNLLPWRANENAPMGFWDLFGGEHGRIADRLGGTDRVTICTERSRRRDPKHWTERGEK